MVMLMLKSEMVSSLPDVRLGVWDTSVKELMVSQWRETDNESTQGSLLDGDECRGSGGDRAEHSKADPGCR